MHVCMPASTCMSICIQMYACKHACIHMIVLNLSTNAYIHTHIHACIFILPHNRYCDTTIAHLLDISWEVGENNFVCKQFTNLSGIATPSSNVDTHHLRGHYLMQSKPATTSIVIESPRHYRHWLRFVGGGLAFALGLVGVYGIHLACGHS